MQRTLILNKLNKKCIMLVSLYWYTMMHGQHNIKHKQTYWRRREGAEIWWCCSSMVTTTLHADWLRSWNCALKQSVKVIYAQCAC
jgi:hypothetical protein